MNKYRNLTMGDGERGRIDQANHAHNAKVKTRQVTRRQQFERSMDHINQVAGGEVRSRRRTMAKKHAKRLRGGK